MHRAITGAFTSLAMTFVVGCSKHAIDLTIPEIPPSEDSLLVDYLTQKVDRVRRSPDSSLHRGQLAMALDANAYREEAVTVYQQARFLDEEDHRWVYLQAHVYAELGQTDAALDALEMAIDLNPDYLPAYIAQGFWLNDIGKETEAESVFQYLLGKSLTPINRTAVLIGLARAQLRLDQPNRALATLREGDVVDSEANVKRLYYQIYQDLGDLDTARSYLSADTEFTEIEWSDPVAQQKLNHVMSFIGRLRLSEDFIRHQDFQAAADILEHLRTIEENDAAVLNNLGIAYMNLGNNERALEALRHGYELHPSNDRLTYNLATLYDELGDVESALVMFEETTRLNPYALSAYERQMKIHVAEGNTAIAKRLLDEISHKSEPSAQIQYYGGLLEGSEGRWQEAVAYFQRAIQLDPKMHRAYINLARCYMELNDYLLALSALDHVQNQEANFPEIGELRRLIHQMMTTAR